MSGWTETAVTPPPWSPCGRATSISVANEMMFSERVHYSSSPGRGARLHRRVPKASDERSLPLGKHWQGRLDQPALSAGRNIGPSRPKGRRWRVPRGPGPRPAARRDPPGRLGRPRSAAHRAHGPVPGDVVLDALRGGRKGGPMAYAVLDKADALCYPVQYTLCPKPRPWASAIA